MSSPCDLLLCTTPPCYNPPLTAPSTPHQDGLLLGYALVRPHIKLKKIAYIIKYLTLEKNSIVNKGQEQTTTMKELLYSNHLFYNDGIKHTYFYRKEMEAPMKIYGSVNGSWYRH